MALSQRRSFWEGRYQELASLSLPGPAVIIDVRQGFEHEPPLVWNLATELKDFTREMELQRIYRWRRLGHCLALFKLNPLPPKHVKPEICDYILTDPQGTSQVLRGQDQLVDALRERIGLVRDNRIGATNDREQRFSPDSPVDPDRPTVHVCFVCDAEDPNSLTSAATYAEWLKQAVHHYDRQWSWRAPQIKTSVICLNVDPHRHSPQVLTDYFRRNLDLQLALDRTILLYRYGDNNAVINEEMQAHQVELLIYVLLLCGLEILDTHEPQLQQTLLNVENEEKATESWPVDLVGISSLENSTRWGTRWLDAGLVAQICQILLNPKSDLSQEAQRYPVHSAWLSWQASVRHFVCDELAEKNPYLKVIKELSAFQAIPGKGKREHRGTGGLADLGERLVRHYGGDSGSLSEALNVAPVIIEQLQQVSPWEQKEGSDELKQHWQELLNQAAQLPSALLLPDALGQSSFVQLDARGLLPRAQQSATILNNSICDIEAIVQNPPDLAESCAQLEAAVARMQLQLKHLWTGKKHSQYEQHLEQLEKMVHRDVEQVQRVIVAQAMLALLQKVGLYEPGGKLAPYQLHLQQLTSMFRQLEREGLHIQEKAYGRLQASLSQVQDGFADGPTRLNLRSRDDLLDWSALNNAFAQLSEDFASLDSALPLLGYWLLGLLNGTDPELLLQQQRQRRRSAPRPVTFEQNQVLEMQELQDLSTLLLALLLLIKLVPASVAGMRTLLSQYMDLAMALDVEPSAFSGIIEQIQREGRLRPSEQNQKASLADFAIQPEVSLFLLLSTWVSSGYRDHPRLNQVLTRKDVFACVTDSRITPAAVFTDLRRRNILLGYPAPMLGSESSYLLLAPGETGKQFLREIDILHMKHYLRVLPFPDIEKMIYLRIHHMDYQNEDECESVPLPSPR